jgi:hypothetical protein
MSIILGIDDTDNLESRGTGYMARQLAVHLHQCGLMEPHIIIRHQLLVSPEIPYTSHNSSASVKGRLTGDIEKLKEELAGFVLTHSAAGSDAAVCLVNSEEFKNTSSLIFWGRAAKSQVLTHKAAEQLAEKEGIFLKGLTGEKTGIIGSLAAVGLNLWGNDGRILWMEGLRETTGIFEAESYRIKMGIDCIKTITHHSIQKCEKIYISDWTRPVMLNNNVTLFVEPVKSNQYEYQSAPKQFIKDISE